MNTFDERAASWDDPVKVERAAVVARHIADALPLSGSTRLLEYGAGTGLVSEALRDRVGPITLADTSTGMREVMEAKRSAGSLPGARIWDLDLSTTAPPDDRFDLIVTVLVLHHIEDLEPVLTGFAALLAPGGHLCIVDLDAEDGSFHGEGFHGHNGFERRDLTAMLEHAGLPTVDIRPCHHVDRPDGRYPMFLAIAAR